MNRLISGMLIVVALIHLLPLVGMSGQAKLAALYGVRIDEPNLVILLRHRAVLFGLLGAYLILAALQPAHQLWALVAGWISVLSFLYFASIAGSFNAAITRVVWADVLAAVCLLIATLARLRLQYSS